MVVQPPAPQAPEAISQEDRGLAAVSHGSLFLAFPVIVPIAIYFYKRETSRFVAFHALQAAILHLSLVPLMIFGYALSFALSLASAVSLDTVHPPSEVLAFLIGASWMLATFVPFGLVALWSLYAAYRSFLGHGYRIPIVWRIAKSFLDAPGPAAPPPI